MRRPTLNFLVDALTLVVFFALVATGLVVKYILPPGSGGRGHGAGQSLWNLGRHDWGDVHFWLAVAVVVLLIVHVALHWTWTCSLVRRWVSPRNRPLPRLVPWRCHLYGIGFLGGITLLFAMFTWLAWENVEAAPGERTPAGWATQDDGSTVRDGPPHEQRDHEQSMHINGQTTLAELEAGTGVSPAQLAADLGIPLDVDRNERLGRLARRYGFSVSDVRRLSE